MDGFRLDIFNYIFKDAEFRDNPFSFKLLPSEEDSVQFLSAGKVHGQPAGKFRVRQGVSRGM